MITQKIAAGICCQSNHSCGILTHFFRLLGDLLMESDGLVWRVIASGEFLTGRRSMELRPMTSGSRPFSLKYVSYLRKRASNSASGNLLLRFRGRSVLGATHSARSLTQLEHGSFLSHLTLRCWHRIHGCLRGDGIDSFWSAALVAIDGIDESSAAGSEVDIVRQCCLLIYHRFCCLYIIRWIIESKRYIHTRG